MPDQKAQTVVRLFVERVILRYGAPQQLLTDTGANFTSRLLSEVCGSLGVQRLLTTPYHPRCNGAVERLSQTVSGMLGHNVPRDQRDWDVLVPFISFAYNSTSHESTKQSPFFLMYGRHPELPLVLYAGPTGNYGTLENYKEELLQRLSSAHDLARRMLANSAEYRKRIFDRKADAPKFAVGDVVCVSDSAGTAGLARKLQAKWRGPFRVVERLSTVTFRVKDLRTGQQNVVHANRLRRYGAGVAEEPDAEVPTNAMLGNRGDSHSAPPRELHRSRDRERGTLEDDPMAGQNKANELIKLGLMEELERAAATSREEGPPARQCYSL